MRSTLYSQLNDIKSDYQHALCDSLKLMIFSEERLIFHIMNVTTHNYSVKALTLRLIDRFLTFSMSFDILSVFTNIAYFQTSREIREELIRAFTNTP